MTSGRTLDLLQANGTGSNLKSNNEIIVNNPPEFINDDMNPIRQSSTKQDLAATLLKCQLGIENILFKEYLRS